MSLFPKEMMSPTISVATVYPIRKFCRQEILSLSLETLMGSSDLDDICQWVAKKRSYFSPWQAIFLRCFIRTY